MEASGLTWCLVENCCWGEEWDFMAASGLGLGWPQAHRIVLVVMCWICVQFGW